MFSSASFIFVLTVLNIVVYYLRIHQEEGQVETRYSPSFSSDQLCHLFSLAEIELATNNFDEALVLGKGGFGTVYKGTINSGATTVAIKRSKVDSDQGATEFWTEIEMLSKFRHTHLVSLLGYCEAGRELILVYEYMPNGTLEDHLHKNRSTGNNSPLTWVQRLHTCVGAARGLDYLHTGTSVQHRVIHRDVKSSNILLDENWTAKISDFGLSRIGPANQAGTTHVYTNHIRGTFGYMDAEYFLTRRVTRKSDVYAFGVVLFEVLCGRPAVDLTLDEQQQGLASWAKRCMQEGTLDQIIDPFLKGQIMPNCLKEFGQIAYKCLLNFSDRRPTMAEVVARLELALALQEGLDSRLDGDIVNTGGAHDSQVWLDSFSEEEVISVGDSVDSSNIEQEFIGASDGDDAHFGTSREFITHSNVGRKFSPRNGGESYQELMVDVARALARRVKRKALVGKVWSRFSTEASVTSGILQATTSTSYGRSSASSWGSSNLHGKSHFVTGSAHEEVVPDGEILPYPNLRIFSFAELKAATRKFRSTMLLGEGDFGKVYKGWLEEKSKSKYNGRGHVIAVKKLKIKNMQGLEEWQDEVNFMGRLSHPNLVKLLGYCWEGTKLLLVYEFMERGNLENHLPGRNDVVPPLLWDIRIKILAGAARGLAFLHATKKRAIDREFKPSNILLDSSYNAKILDIGLGIKGLSNGQSHIRTQVVGRYGYAAPEYILSGHLLVKSDVYGFGTVLVEMLTGMRASDLYHPAAQRNMVDWVKPYLVPQGQLNDIMDPLLEGRYSLKAAAQISQLALKCLESEPGIRPSMKEVVQTLEQLEAINESTLFTQSSVSASSSSSSSFMSW